METHRGEIWGCKNALLRHKHTLYPYVIKQRTEFYQFSQKLTAKDATRGKYSKNKHVTRDFVKPRNIYKNQRKKVRKKFEGKAVNMKSGHQDIRKMSIRPVSTDYKVE